LQITGMMLTAPLLALFSRFLAAIE